MIPRVFKTTSGKRMLLLKCAVCSTKKSRFFKKEEARGILSSLVSKHQYARFHYLAIFYFKFNFIKYNSK